MSNYLLGFSIANLREHKLMLLMFYIFMLIATDFTNLMANIVFCEFLAVICFLPLIFISLIALAVAILWGLVTFLQINIVKYILAACLFMIALKVAVRKAP